MLDDVPGVDVNKAENGRTPLYAAAKKGFLDLVRMLLQQPSIDVNAGDINERDRCV